MQDTDHQSPSGTPFKASVGRRGGRVVRYVLAFVTAVLVIDAVVGDKGLLALLDARKEYQALEMSLNHARAENRDLREEARRLREDPSAIEDLARKDLGLIMPGETLFIIKDVTPKSQK
jgi:cell division protein FtsB